MFCTHVIFKINVLNRLEFRSFSLGPQTEDFLRCLQSIGVIFWPWEVITWFVCSHFTGIFQCFPARDFRQEFSTYAQKSLDKLTRSFVETSSALESNKWLAGAKVIYNVVKSKRSAKRKATKSFLDWVGVRHDVDRLAVGKWQVVDMSHDCMKQLLLTLWSIALLKTVTDHRQNFSYMSNFPILV